MTVEPQRRAVALSLLKGWKEGKSTNYELQDKWPAAKGDLAIDEIGDQLWLLYDDFPERLLVFSKLSQEEQLLVDRCIAFLNSDCEFLWPRYPRNACDRGWISQLFPCCRRLNDMKIQRFESTGDRTFWPFISEEQRRDR